LLFGGINLTGPLPQNVNLSSIRDNRFNVLQLENNNLSGEIPNWITQHNFIIVNLSNNQLEGELPEGFFNNGSRIYERLRNLYLFRNNLEGPLPNVDFGPDIRNLFFYENNFSGRIPAEWGNIETAGRGTGLTIRLQRNNLSGKIPSEVAHITMISPGKLLAFDISGNQFHNVEISEFEQELLARHPGVDFDKSNQNPSGDPDLGDDSGNEPEPPASPSLQSPSNNAQNVSVTPRFEWTAVDSDHYEIQVNSTNPSGTLFVETVNGTGYTHSSSLDPGETYRWRVRAVKGDLNGSWTSYRQFTTEPEENDNDDGGSDDGSTDGPEAPTPLSPANDAENVSLLITIEWTSVDADEYILHMDRIDENGSYEYFYSDNEGVTITENSYTFTEETLPNTRHGWRVRAVKDGVAGEWSPIWRFTTEEAGGGDDGGNGGDDSGSGGDDSGSGGSDDGSGGNDDSGSGSDGDDSPGVPALLSPNQNANNVRQPITFEWEAVDADHYQVQVSEPGSSSPAVDAEVDETSYTLSVNLDPETTYRWRVRAVKDGVEGEWSSYWQFTTRKETGNGPAKSSPANNSNNNSNRPVFRWNSVESAESYTIEITSADYTDSADDFYLTDETADTVYTPRQHLRANARYQWRVRANFADGSESDWGDAWEFEINGELAFETELGQNYPNPFNPTTNIRFTLGDTQEVSLRVYDMAGRLVATLYNNTLLQSGPHETTFNASSLASGIYFYRIITETEVITRKMTLMK
jgi:hypothetical protein